MPTTVPSQLVKYMRRLSAHAVHEWRIIRHEEVPTSLQVPASAIADDNLNEKLYEKHGQNVHEEVPTSLQVPASAIVDDNLYERLYEKHGQNVHEEESIGAGDYDMVGRIELEFLKKSGLRASHTLLDFGCGTGRLAVHAVPYLSEGEYLGTDIAQSMLEGARRRVARTNPDATCKVAFAKQRLEVFDFPAGRVDMICAFSVFTHMEHEDTYKYLVDARRIVRDRGKFVFSCLPMDLVYSKQVFSSAAAASFGERWSRVRDVTTSVDLMNEISTMAGWRVAAWYRGDVPSVTLPDGNSHLLGQSVCVLEPT